MKIARLFLMIAGCGGALANPVPNTKCDAHLVTVYAETAEPELALVRRTMRFREPLCCRSSRNQLPINSAADPIQPQTPARYLSAASSPAPARTYRYPPSQA